MGESDGTKGASHRALPSPRQAAALVLRCRRAGGSAVPALGPRAHGGRIHRGLSLKGGPGFELALGVGIGVGFGASGYSYQRGELWETLFFGVWGLVLTVLAVLLR